jgi:hypothetical protein
MRVILLLIVAAIFLTGLVWWVTFLGNALLTALRKR